VTRLATITQPNLRAFMDMIAVSEIGAKLLAASDDGYNVLVGGKLFTGYADHPRQLITLNPKLKSSAAGRYQLLARYFDAYKAQLHLLDFSPESQDAICLQQIREQRALEAIVAGKFEVAVQ
jgi:muramidase (phage lysozyme)